ncbi:MAG: SPOR domain-containing protein [Bacteroidales bacterium]|nr:SPOR domain-containing protein [Bacteroidales bacterium]
MKKSCILMMLFLLPVMTGCDFMRKLAGRPTGEEVENMRIELLRAEEAALQARLDSLRKVEERMLQDSLNALDSIRQLGGSILNPASLGGLFATKLESRYYIILGSFRSRANAEALFNVTKAAGYRPALISFGKGGLIAVGVCPVNRLSDALTNLSEVKKESFCPKDVWILVNE